MNRTVFSALVALAMVAPAAAALAPTTLSGGDNQRYIVALTEDAGLRAGDSYNGAQVIKFLEGLNFLIVEVDSFSTFEARAKLDQRVRYIVDDVSDHKLHLVPDDYFYGHAAHWGSKRIGGEAAWDVTTGTTSVKVAMVDSGLNKGHEEYSGQARVLQGYDFRDGDTEPEDTKGCNWHGTHTTGTAGATINNAKGIAGMSQHTILPVKIFGAGFFGCGTTTTAIVEALKYTGDQGSHVSSNSWGGGSSDSAINDAIAYAHNKGVIHVAAAGNDGPCTNCVGQPWRDNPAITFVVTSLTDGDIFSDFSSEGPEVDIIAPGDYIASSTSGTSDYHAYSGTSMATPHVAGSIALYLAVNPGSSFSTVENALASTAENLGFTTDRQGHGLVRADLLVGSSGGGTTNSPPTATFTYTCSGLTCDFDGSGSSDTDGTISSYAWDFGDGTTATGATVTHTFGASGDYTVTLTVTDDAGATGTDSQLVSVSDGTSSGISLSASGYKVKGVQHVDLTWSGATSTNVDVYRDGALLTTTVNDGAYTDNIGKKGGATYTYKVCEAGTTTCSNDATVTF